MSIVRCIDQIVETKEYIPSYIRPKGCGDCTTCKPCLENKNCSCYTPVLINTFDVKHKDNEFIS